MQYNKTESPIYLAILDLLAYLGDHLEDVELEFQAKAHLIRRTAPIWNVPILNDHIDTASHIFRFYISKLANNLANSWREHVRKQLALGGGKLFAWISKSDKAFLNVDWAAKGALDPKQDSTMGTPWHR